MGCISSTPAAETSGPAAKHRSPSENAASPVVPSAPTPPPPQPPASSQKHPAAEAGSSPLKADAQPLFDRQQQQQQHGTNSSESQSQSQSQHPSIPSDAPSPSQEAQTAAAAQASSKAQPSPAPQEAAAAAASTAAAAITQMAAAAGAGAELAAAAAAAEAAVAAAAAEAAAAPAAAAPAMPAVTAAAAVPPPPPTRTTPTAAEAAAAAPDAAALRPALASSLSSPRPSSSSLRMSGKPDRSNLSRRVDDGEDSDWDQYSTENIQPEQEQGEGAGQGSKPSTPSAAAAETNAAAEEAAFIRETSILRIDKVKGCVFVNQYLVVKFLGRGACGKVFLCLNTHDLCLYAMKAVRKVELANPPVVVNGKVPRNPMDDLKREVMIMKSMRHPNIVTLSEVIDDPQGSKLMLVMEYMDRGPVLTREALERRERLPEAVARQYFRDMIKALDYLHTHKIVHGDLKPENVLLAASGDVKLSDFGCSKVFATGNEYMDRCNGTPAFLAPEMMKPNTKYRGRPTDVYALGACLYTLLFGRIPFSAPSLYKLFEVVQREPVQYPDDVPISMQLKHMLERMLTKSPKERITLPELMRHPWVSMDGQFPIKSLRQLQPGETSDVHDKLTDGVSFDHCNPRPVGLPSLTHLSSHERTFGAGEIIMKQGEIGMFALFIVSGTADVLVKWTPPKAGGSKSAGGSGSAGAPSSSFSQDEFMDESEVMSPITDEDSRENRIKLLHASVKAQDFIQNLQEAAAGSGPCTNDLLVAQRGPGELLGDMALFRKNKSRCATVRCATDLCVLVILKDQLYKYMMDNTVAKLQIRESILSKESEITMVDSLVKLANSYPVIAASLEPTMWGE